MSYRGDLNPGDILDFKFTTVAATGAPTVLAGSPVVSIYKDNSLTQITAGITLSVDMDGVVGLNGVRVDTSANGTAYSAGSNYHAVITTGTVGGVSVVGYVIAEFSIHARSALRPTTPGLTLDITAGGNAAIDLGNVANQGATLALTATTIKASTDTEARLPAALVGGKIDASVGALTPGVITAAAFTAGAIDAAAIAPNAIGASELAADAVTEIQAGLATAAALSTVSTNVDAILVDTGTTLQAELDGIQADTEDIQVALAVVDDFLDTEVTAIKGKTDQLTFTTPNVVDASGSGGASAAAIADAVWDELTADHVGAGSTGAAVAAGGSSGDPWITPLPGAYAAGTAGKIVGDRIAASVAGAVGSVTGNVGGNVAGSVASVTGAVGSVTVVTDKTGYRLSSTGVGDLLTTALTEAYAANGAAPTLTQFLYMIQQHMMEKGIVSTTMTVNKLDGTTPAATFTLNSATTPTAISRTS